MWTIWTSLSAVRKRPLNLITHSLTGSGSGLLPEDTKPWLEPMLIYHQRCSLVFTWKQFHKRCSWTQSVMCVQRLHFWNYDHISQGPMNWWYFYYIFRWVSLCMWVWKNEMENMSDICCGLQHFNSFICSLIHQTIHQTCMVFCFSFLFNVQAVSNVQMVSHGIHGNQIRWWRMKWEPLENTYSDGVADKMDWAKYF